MLTRESDEQTLDQGSPQSLMRQENADPGKNEAGEKKPESVGFCHPSLKKTRHYAVKHWAITTLILAVFVLGILSLFWAVLHNVDQNLSSLVVWVVDFDGQVAPYTDTTPIVGPQIITAAEQMIAPDSPCYSKLGWGSLPASAFNYDPMQVREAIYDEKAWAAVIVMPNATALLQAAIQTGNTSYDPMGAAQIVYVQARDETTHGNYVTPVLMEFQSMVTSTFGSTWTKQAIQHASTNTTILSNLKTVPQALNPAISFSTFNLRPFYPETATPAMTIGLIYLIIISFFSFSFYLPIHMKYIQPEEGHPPLKFYQLIIWRWIATISAYFFLSLAYSLISLAFQIPFSAGPAEHTAVANPATAYGRGSFPVYWMLNWVGMVALGLACENVAMIFGQPWTAFWLVFWVISNVSTSFYSITLAPGFYRWGYAWPLHNIVNASRTIIFDTHSRIGLNFGILFVWCTFNSVLFPGCCWFMRWKSLREKKKGV